MTRQVLRPEREPVFHSLLPCLITGYFWSDTALSLVMTSPHRPYLTSVRKNKGHQTETWQRLWAMQCAANRMCPGSHHFQFSFFCSGRYRVRVPMTAERIMHQLWNQAVLNVYLLSLILHLLNRCKLHGGYYEIHIQQVQKKVCLNSSPDKTKDAMYCISTRNLRKTFQNLLWT